MSQEIRKCKVHGNTIYKEYSEGNNKKCFRCLECRAESTKKIYNYKKQKAVNHLGGKCSKCGYNKCLNALDFHHLDPLKKDIAPAKVLSRSWDNILKEINKCIVLCANCHRELHSK